MRDFAVQFGAPRNGWMTIKVMAGVQQWQADVSDVPCDSIRYLVSSLSMLLQGNREATVEWSLEPGYAKWILLRTETSLDFAIMHSDKPDRQLVYCGKVRETVHRFIKALCDLAAEQCWPDENLPTAAWSWSFPKQELQQLRALCTTTLREAAKRGD